MIVKVCCDFISGAMETSRFIHIHITNIPSVSGIYIWYFKKDKKPIPFYVGQSNNIRRRSGEYLVSSWWTSTDFLVGESIKYLQKRGYSITLEYKVIKDSAKRKNIEKEKINELKEKYRLINKEDRHGISYHYKDYKKENRPREIKKIIIKLHNFIDDNIIK